MIDADRKPGCLILTGSQIFPLMQNVSESLAGRCSALTVMNLSADELRSFQKRIAFKEADFLFKGGYPELHARPGMDAHFWYRAYMTTYLERDVRNILNVGNKVCPVFAE